MKLENAILQNGDLEIKLTFDIHDQLCLKHDLIDIVEWYAKGPSREKIHSCKKRMINENKDRVMQLPEMQNKTLSEINAIMNDEIALCDLISKMPGYKNRLMREQLDQ